MSKWSTSHCDGTRFKSSDPNFAKGSTLRNSIDNYMSGPELEEALNNAPKSW